MIEILLFCVFILLTTLASIDLRLSNEFRYYKTGLEVVDFSAPFTSSLG